MSTAAEHGDGQQAPNVVARGSGVDPTWPQVADGEHALTEFTADRQGSLSPFGDVTFPRDAAELPYEHPTTVINR